MSKRHAAGRPVTLANEIDDVISGHVRRIADVLADQAEAVESAGFRLAQLGDEALDDLSGQELERRAHDIRSATSSTFQLLADIQRLAGRLETLAAIRRARSATENGDDA